MSFRMTVYGKPQPAGSKRAFVKGGRAIVTDANKNAAPWKQEVAGAAVGEMDGKPPFDRPVQMDVIYRLARPKSHYRTGRFSDVLRDDAPTYHTTKPDALKLTRAIEDALTGIVYRDDSLIAQATYTKLYGTVESCTVGVRPL